ncbi:hypothetical protein MIND_00367200 [Mycena indigotica]|uniref:DUF6534 domain-containing protein n=1 Tax=Mycena indigotica TaxID=2126181 RepID=A0A8H6WB81_9AGAR|nr:uncharacterized protein MIND_00367200 [Mycena indigotica]KAF7309946.1 hypothetical protein MIND_00367200 [Mycena indigotica]
MPSQIAILLPVYLSVVGNGLLFGIACMQAFQYSLGLNAGHLGLVVTAMWEVLEHWPTNAIALSMTLLWADLVTAFMAFASQLFFAGRIYKFLGRTRLAFVILAVFTISSLYQLGGYIAFTVLCAKTKLNATMFQYEKLVWSIWGMAAGQDILISLILIGLIYHHGSRSLPSTVQLVQRVTIFAINTGLWTSLCALFVIITMVAFPLKEAWIGLYLMICPLYCNTVLANLNGRNYIRGTSTIALNTLELPSSKSGSTTHQDVEPQVSNIVFASHSGAIDSRTNGSQLEDLDDKV